MRPRYFVASASAPPGRPDRDDPGRLVNALAVVQVGAAELVVGTDGEGRLRAVSGGERAAMTARVQAQLAYHEVTSPAPVGVSASEVWLLDVQVVELLRDAPGLNDPLHLYGSLRGAYPWALEREVASVEGQLTVTRSDLLGGLVAGVERAFKVEPSSAGARCIHAMVPGGPPAEMQEGRGLVLAFPLAHLPIGDDPPNELVVAQTLYDVLSALRADLGDDGAAPLPVPSRRALEAELAADGWHIDGDRAVRKKGGIGGRLLGVGKKERTLPPQGTLEDYVTEARTVLARLTPAPARASTPPVRRSTAPRPAVSTTPDEWMKDFSTARPSPGKTRPRAKPRPAVIVPRVSRPARVLSQEAPASPPDWMRDFKEPAAKPEPEPEAQPAERPDWSKDFD